MNPTVPAVLAELAGLVMRNAAPDVAASDRANALGLTAALLVMAAEAFDGAAAMLVAENRAFRALLQRGAAHLSGDLDLGDEEDLRVSALQAINARLRQGLIDLHTLVEGVDAELEAAVWHELVASTGRRRTAGMAG